MALLVLSGLSGFYALTPEARASALPNQVCVTYDSNPVLNSSQPWHWHFTSGGVTYNVTDYATSPLQPSVLALNGGFAMWFGGTVNNMTGIFRAQSADAINWNIDPTPVLRPGLNGTWDQGNVYSPSVLQNGTGYLMYFSGTTGTPSTRSIGVAFSSDGVHWNEYADNPVIKGGPGPYDSYWARFPSVIYDGQIYRMWYTGHANFGTTSYFLTIDYATSPDGLHWTKYPGNPVLAGKDFFAEMSSVVKVKATYLMAYVGNGSGISYASSDDGINWVTPPYQLVEGGPNETLFWPNLLLNGSTLLLWYYQSLQINAQGTNYIAGIGLGSCSFAFISDVKTTTMIVTTAESTTVTGTTVTTVTQIRTVTTISTTPSPVGLPTAMLEVGTASALVIVSALIALLIIRIASRRPPI